MVDFDELSNQLVALPPHTYSSLIKKVDAERRVVAEREERENPPRAGMNRDEFAQWLAEQHYAIDKGITRVVYAPTGAPENEVRLLEINELARIPEQAPIEAFDYNPNIPGLDYLVFVADVSPRQFELLQKGEIAPPKGWSLTGAREIPWRE